MNTFKYKIADKEYVVEIAEVSDTDATVIVNGETFAVTMDAPAEEEKPKVVLGTTTDDEAATPAAAVNTANAIKAPLPGIVIEIKVKVGDKVSVGDTLVVLEAMKMANNLDAEVAGTVTAVCVRVGESVMEDAPLVVVE